MAVSSSMVPLGSAMPPFSLPDLIGNQWSSAELTGSPTLIAFVCNHCPYVKHVETVFGQVAQRHPATQTLAICSNDAQTYPDDDRDHLAEQLERAKWNFPYLIDETQEVGRQFGAVCTPDFFVYDADNTLVYRGAMDDSTPGNQKPVTGDLLDTALTLIEAGESVPEPHRPSLGCSIKWRDSE